MGVQRGRCRAHRPRYPCRRTPGDVVGRRAAPLDWGSLAGWLSLPFGPIVLSQRNSSDFIANSANRFEPMASHRHGISAVAQPMPGFAEGSYTETGFVAASVAAANIIVWFRPLAGCERCWPRQRKYGYETMAESAACGRAQAELFDLEHAHHGALKRRCSKCRAALMFCASCPVRGACLQAALADGDRQQIRGGVALVGPARTNKAYPAAQCAFCGLPVLRNFADTCCNTCENGQYYVQAGPAPL
jgi:hypothetical protein